jgi:chromosome segregation ATPase
MAVDVTTATLVAWGAAAVLVGFALGWVLRPWAMADRTGREQAEALAAETELRTAAETGLSTTQADLDATTVDLTTARGEIVDLRHELEATQAALADAQGRLEEAEARAAAAAAPR